MTLIEAQCSKRRILEECNDIHVFKIKVLVFDDIIRILNFRVAFQTIDGTMQRLIRRNGDRLWLFQILRNHFIG